MSTDPCRRMHMPLIVLMAFLITGLMPFSLQAQVTADFSGDPLEGEAPLTVVFTDQSTGSVVIWLWTFHDGGNPATATGPGPHTVTYDTYGYKDVTLQVTGTTPPQGGPRPTDTETKSNYVYVRPPDRDYGDAPDDEKTMRYPTLSSHDGAYHMVSQNIFLGNTSDAEYEAKPDASATGDDLDNDDDEDGVAIPPLVPGTDAYVTVDAHGAGFLSAWIDWNQDNDWADSGEKVVNSQALGDGPNTVVFAVPAAAPMGPTFARFRYNVSSRELSYDNYGDEGEVEDYQVYVTTQQQGTYDYGDAPDAVDAPVYPTLMANGGAFHSYSRTCMLGSYVDIEGDGQPNIGASGDDASGAHDDEDGVMFSYPIVRGQPGSVTVTVNGSGHLFGWIDWDQDGVWEPAEQVWDGMAVSTGVYPVSGVVPGDAALGLTYARFRICSENIDVGPSGFGGDGEVEDYAIYIEDSVRYDFGDAPDPTYPTRYIADGAAYHIVTDTLMLGSAVDAEAQGWASPQANGDDNHGDDEDGVELPPSFIQGETAIINVTVQGTGRLSAWIDWNHDGDWADAALNEHIIAGAPVSTGTHPFSVDVPIMAVPGPSFARFRLEGVIGPVDWGRAVKSAGRSGEKPLDVHFAGPGGPGEVEDYKITIEEGDVFYDYGDAPDPGYATLEASSGARHVVVDWVHLGASVDIDADGQPNGTATGDDGDGNDDEDGVSFPDPLVPGMAASAVVTLSWDGILMAWIDWNQDGIWDTPTELICDVGLGNGTHTVDFMVPATAVTGITYARFRYTTFSMMFTEDMEPAYGEWPDGEVEDYLVEIVPTERPHLYDFGDAPNEPGLMYPTLEADDGARHEIVMLGPIILMGPSVDVDPDGLPHLFALGDDLVGMNDEDGVHHQPLYIPGLTNFILVHSNNLAVLNGWMDFNIDGDWADGGEHIIVDRGVGPGPNLVDFNVPAGATGGLSFARYRLSTMAGLSYVGEAPNGEVEDYPVIILDFEIVGSGELDYGDAPDDTTLGYFYPVRLQDDGARHIVSTRVFLGDTIDAETHGQPSLDADEDELTDAWDDDGVFVPMLMPGETDTMTVITRIGYGDTAYFHAWFDWNGDGDWADTLEYVYEYHELPRGIWKLPVTPPDTAKIGPTFARFRWSEDTTIYYYGGLAINGEVEDYKIWIDSTSYTRVERKPVKQLPETFSLEQNYPNPFNPETTIEYALSAPAAVTLSIYDLRGREVIRLVQEQQQAGRYLATWQGRDWRGLPVATGLYIYRIEIHSGKQKHVITRKMAFVK